MAFRGDSFGQGDMQQPSFMRPPPGGGRSGPRAIGNDRGGGDAMPSFLSQPGGQRPPEAMGDRGMSGQMRTDGPPIQRGQGRGGMPTKPWSPYGRSEGMPGIDPAAGPGAGASKPGAMQLQPPPMTSGVFGGGTPEYNKPVDPAAMAAKQTAVSSMMNPVATAGGVPGGVPGAPGVPSAGAAVGMGDLGALIERRMANPTAFTGEVIQQQRDALGQQRAASRMEGEGRISADAARRGVFQSTIPTMDRLKLESGLAGQEAIADANFATQRAQAIDQGSANAVGEAMSFQNSANNNQLQQMLALGQLGSMSQNAGNAGAPTFGGATAGLMQLPAGVPPGTDPALFQLLGNMMGGQRQPQQPQGV